jgi:predicted RNA-binding protein with TRAM domain
MNNEGNANASDQQHRSRVRLASFAVVAADAQKGKAVYDKIARVATALTAKGIRR